MPFAVAEEAWGDFLCGIYDAWTKGDQRRVSIRLFDSILTRLVEGTYNVCHMGRNCRQYFVVEHNGDVYPCDFFVEAGLKLGNVEQDTWEGMDRSATYVDFGRRKAEWNEACEACDWLEFCSGDCLKHRFEGLRDARRLSYLCKGWQRFFAHALPGLRRMAAEIARERSARAALASPRGAASAPVGRNEPCPCGSGRKFKACCMGRR